MQRRAQGEKEYMRVEKGNERKNVTEMRLKVLNLFHPRRIVDKGIAIILN